MKKKTREREKVQNKEDEELNLIKNYLQDLNSSTQQLYNANYVTASQYNAHIKKKKQDVSGTSSILNCLKLKGEDKNRFKSIDVDSSSEQGETSKEDSYSEDEESSGSSKKEKATKKKKNINKLNKKNKKNLLFTFAPTTNEKKNCTVKDSRFNQCKIFSATQSDEEFYETLRNSTIKKKRRGKDGGKNWEKREGEGEGKGEEGEEGEEEGKGKGKRKGRNRTSSAFENNNKISDGEKSPFNIHKTFSNKHKKFAGFLKPPKNLKKREDNVRRSSSSETNTDISVNSDDIIFSERLLGEEKWKRKKKATKEKRHYSSNDSEIYCDEKKKDQKTRLRKKRSNDSNEEENHFVHYCKYEDEKNKKQIGSPYDNFPITSDMKNLKMKDLKTKMNSQMFLNKREHELFQYLITKALDEIDAISKKLKHKYETDLVYHLTKVKSENQNNLKEVVKQKGALLMEKEWLTESNKEYKDRISELENHIRLLEKQIETLRKKNENMHDICYKNELNKNSEEMKLKKVNEQLEMRKKQLDENKKKIQMLNEDMNQNYEKLFYYQNKWNETEKTLHLKEADIEKLKNDLEQLLKTSNEQEKKIKHLQSENEKIERLNDSLRNDLNKTNTELAKWKQANEENCQNKEYTLSLYKIEEKKLKEELENYKTKCAMLENNRESALLQEKYNSLKSKLEKTEMEKIQFEKDSLKNEKQKREMEQLIKDLKNELFEYKNKYYAISKARNNPNYKPFQYNSTTECFRETQNIQEKEQPKYSTDDNVQHSGYCVNVTDSKQTINSLEQQLILLKLEKTNNESELIRCPKYGRKRNEIQKKEILEDKLKYLDDKINMLNKNLKYIKMHTYQNPY